MAMALTVAISEATSACKPYRFRMDNTPLKTNMELKNAGLEDFWKG